ncbi:MAG: hypothetical protein KDK40_00525, partial [Chlamydiia bacterium]|nr:hypothetical protein [Chlamydiia bacterium]
MWETITTAVNATYDYTVETWNAPPIEIDLGALSKWETVLWVWKEVNTIPDNHKVFFDLTNRKVIHRPIQTSNAAIIGEAVAQWQKNYHSADTITVLENVVNITEQTLLKCEKELSHEFIMKTLFPLITILKAGSQSKLEKLATTLNGNANLMTSSSNEQKRFQRIFNLSLRCPEFLDRSEKLVRCVRKTFRNERIPLINNSLKKALGEISHSRVISELDPELVREQFDTYFSSDAVNKAWKVGNLSREGIGTFNEGDVYAILRHIIIHWNPSDAAFSKLDQIIEMKFISQFSRDDNHLPSERLFHIEDLRRRLVSDPTPPLQFDKEQAARD